MARLDRRRRPLLGPGDAEQPGHLRPPQDHHLASEPDLLRRPALRSRFALALARRGQRALLREADRSRPEAVRPVARRARRELRARSVRGRDQISRASRSARAERRSRTARRCRSAPISAYATGIVGLRLFPNPDFDQAAKDKWDPERYYTDPNYYNDPNLVRPYRVGMACGFCHVGPSPIHPPADPAHPQWSEPQLDGRRAISLDGPRLRLDARTRRTSSTSSCIPIRRARWTLRSSRPTTSTIRAP